MSEPIAGVGFATLLAGATPFNAGNVNDTYRAQVLLGDGRIAMAIVKDLDQRQLANELLASTLAKAVGLPTPDVYLAVVRPAILPLSKAPALQDGNRIAFASADVRSPSVVFRYRENPSLEASLLQTISSWGGLGRCYGFDTWIANIDRHAGNLLFGGPKDVWLIDHGHGFTGPAWTASDLKPEGEYIHRLSSWLTPAIGIDDRKIKAGEAAGLEAVTSKLDLDALVQASLVDRILPSDEVAALKQFLRDRCAYVAYYSNKALGVPSII